MNIRLQQHANTQILHNFVLHKGRKIRKQVRNIITSITNILTTLKLHDTSVTGLQRKIYSRISTYLVKTSTPSKTVSQNRLSVQFNAIPAECSNRRSASRGRTVATFKTNMKRIKFAEISTISKMAGQHLEPM